MRNHSTKLYSKVRDFSISIAKAEEAEEIVPDFYCPFKYAHIKPH